MVDETKEKIVKATLKLIAERGYSSTTTKDIANLACVNEITIFRKFQNKKGIIIYALKEVEWFKELKDDIIFNQCCWSLEKDLTMFSNMYFKYVTSEYVKIIIGLRSPQLYPEIKEYVLKLPNSFKDILIKYFSTMYERKKIAYDEFEILAGMFISLNFGFIFMKVSFDDKLISVSDQKYIEKSIKIFTKGICL